MNKDYDPREYDPLYDPVMASLTITVYQSGAMSVGGCINDKNYALSLIDAARETVINHHIKKGKDVGAGIILPSHDNPLS